MRAPWSGCSVRERPRHGRIGGGEGRRAGQEGQPVLRMMAVDTIEGAGFEGPEAGDADDSVRLLQSRADIRIVFSHVHMADGSDGFRLVHAIRDRRPARGVFFSQPGRWSDVAAVLHRPVA